MRTLTGSSNRCVGPADRGFVRPPSPRPLTRAPRASYLAMLLLVAVAGCSPGDRHRPDGPSARGLPPAEPPSITGTVTAVGPGRTLRIEERPQEPAGSEKAQVRVPEGARIIDSAGARLAFEEIRAGEVASAWFTGPVAESYPVQATASAIVVRR